MSGTPLGKSVLNDWWAELSRLLAEVEKQILIRDAVSNPIQCLKLIKATTLVGKWVVQEHDHGELTQGPVCSIFRYAAKARTLLQDQCDAAIGDKKWLMRAFIKGECKEDFSQVIQGYLGTLKGYVYISEVLDAPAQDHEDVGGWAHDEGERATRPAEVSSIILQLEVMNSELQGCAVQDRGRLISRLLEYYNHISNLAQAEEDRSICTYMLSRFSRAASAPELPCRLAYNCEEALGAGSFAVVSRMSWRGFSIAKKLYRSSIAADDIETEWHAMLRLNHINIIRVIGYARKKLGEDGHEPFLLMECMKGNLDVYMDRGRAKGKGLPLPISIEILLQTAKAMAYLHEKKIIHRDLKPENILLDHWPGFKDDEEQFTVKIADFGSCRENFNTDILTRELTGNRGTSVYMAPEVKEVDPEGSTRTPLRYSKAADVYSFAMVCYKVLTGNDPNVRAKNAKQGKRPEVKPSSLCPPVLVSLMRRCWHNDPPQRPSFSKIVEFLTLVNSIVMIINPPPVLAYPELPQQIVAKLESILTLQDVSFDPIEEGPPDVETPENIPLVHGSSKRDPPLVRRLKKNIKGKLKSGCTKLKASLQQRLTRL